ncbi:MAG: SDR family oxidoreductase [Deltaproteobacteria bacterium]|nr:MAG: SDR family oxidoreductase [Deltaproteobacteria bacterium]
MGAATEAAARVWAIEYAPVRINVVVPGIIDTEVWDEVLPPDAKHAQFEAVESSLPVGRVGTPDDVAKAVEFLLTNEFVTGTAIEIPTASTTLLAGLRSECQATPLDVTGSIPSLAPKAHRE